MDIVRVILHPAKEEQDGLYTSIESDTILLLSMQEYILTALKKTLGWSRRRLLLGLGSEPKSDAKSEVQESVCIRAGGGLVEEQEDIGL